MSASRVLDRLAVRPDSNLDEGESDYLETLTLLIQAYDAQHFNFPMKHSSPSEVLRFLVKENHVKQLELSNLLGVSPGAVSMILKGQRPVTAEHARRLARRFAVDPGLFL